MIQWSTEKRQRNKKQNDPQNITQIGTDRDTINTGLNSCAPMATTVALFLLQTRWYIMNYDRTGTCYSSLQIAMYSILSDLIFSKDLLNGQMISVRFFILW